MRLTLTETVPQQVAHSGREKVAHFNREFTLLARDDENAVAVDLFEQQDLNVDRSGRGDRAIFQSNLERYAGGTGRLTIISNDSTRITGGQLRGAVGGSLRLLSIDGGHLAHIVRHDLQTARDAICEGGVIILDDYFNPEFPGVSEGTAAFFLAGERGEIVPFLVAANKVYLTTRDYAAKYIECFSQADLGLSYEELSRFRFHEGPSSPIVITEFFGGTVISYSPDKYSAAQKLRRTFTRLRRRVRGRLGAPQRT